MDRRAHMELFPMSRAVLLLFPLVLSLMGCLKDELDPATPTQLLFVTNGQTIRVGGCSSIATRCPGPSQRISSGSTFLP